jgi:hypothetical protein
MHGGRSFPLCWSRHSIASREVPSSNIGTSLSQFDSDCGTDSATAASHKGHSIPEVFHANFSHEFHAGMADLAKALRGWSLERPSSVSEILDHLP